MTQNSFELFTSWAIAENPNLANWTVVVFQETGSFYSLHHFPLVVFLSQGFYTILPNCLPDRLTYTLHSKEGMAVYWFSYFHGCYSSPVSYPISFHRPSNVLFYLCCSQGSCMLSIILKNEYWLSGGCSQLKQLTQKTKFKKFI